MLSSHGEGVGRAPAQNTSFTIIMITNPTTSARQHYLNRSEARSHAATVAHLRRRQSQLERHGRPGPRLNRPIDSNKSSAPVATAFKAAASSEELSTNAQNHRAGHTVSAASQPRSPVLRLHYPPRSAVGLLDPSGGWQQGRSLQFYLENTAPNMVGWYDSEFWRVTVPQASVEYVCLRHGLVAIGAYYEAIQLANTVPERSEELKKFSLAQGQQAVSSLAKQHDGLPAGVQLSAYVLLAAVSGFFHPKSHLQSITLQHNYKDHLSRRQNQLESDVQPTDRRFILQNLEPFLLRQRSRYAQLIDPQHALRTAPSTDFHLHNPVRIPETFSSLSHARTILEEILRSKTVEAKGLLVRMDARSVYTDNSMVAWKKRLEDFAASRTLSSDDILTVKILRISATILSILIATMNSEDEMIFDQFTPEYRELVEVFYEASIPDRENSRSHINFGIENSFAAFCVGPALRWCRSPDIRRDLICAFRATDRQEGIDAAWIWADIFELTQTIEESGIHPPPLTCHDIPLENRRRVVRIEVHIDLNLILVRYLRYPFRAADVEDYWIPHPGVKNMLFWPSTSTREGSLPDIIYGRGFAAILRSGEDRDYWTVRDPKFFFNIPRL